MIEEKGIYLLDGERIMAEYGPMRMIISAWAGKLPKRKLCISAARQAFSYFERVAAVKNELCSLLWRGMKHTKNSVVQSMIESVRVIGDNDLTPMAAVAGSLADAVADFLFARGMTKVVVNNGGDIAVRLIGEEQVKVGIGSTKPGVWLSNVVLIDSSFSSWGIATSGLGGRSFTRGISSKATVLASTASIADAAATAIANASFVEDDNVVQRKAGEIDPGTDIPDLMVTVKVGYLSHEKRMLAIRNALKKAERMVKKGHIYGACVTVGEETGATSFFQNRLESKMMSNYANG